MALTSKEGILKVLNAYNPWWKTGMPNAALTKTYKRFAFYEAMERMENESIRRTVVLSGTRRVGKTTIMYQMIEALLRKGISPRRILFVSLDHPMLKLSAFNEILESFHETIYPDDNVYYFFDEIQYAQEKEELFEQRGSFVKISIDDGEDTSMSISGLTVGKTYYFRIRCYGSYTNSSTQETTFSWSQYSDTVEVEVR